MSWDPCCKPTPKSSLCCLWSKWDCCCFQWHSSERDCNWGIDQLPQVKKLFSPWTRSETEKEEFHTVPISSSHDNLPPPSPCCLSLLPISCDNPSQSLSWRDDLLHMPPKMDTRSSEEKQIEAPSKHIARCCRQKAHKTASFYPSEKTSRCKTPSVIYRSAWRVSGGLLASISWCESRRRAHRVSSCFLLLKKGGLLLRQKTMRRPS